MKKLSLIFIFLFIFTNFVFADVVYNQKSVRDYKTEMDKVKISKKTYILEVEQFLEGCSDSAVLYHKAYLKNGKWRADTSTDNGKTYPMAFIFDGKDCIMYMKDLGYGIKLPKFVHPTKDLGEYAKKFANNASNPVDALFYWDGNGSLFNLDNAKIINNNANMNGFSCRLIKMDDFAEACINDNLGIAVYYRLKSKEALTGMEQVNILNLKKVSTADFPDTVFKIPASAQIIDSSF